MAKARRTGAAIVDRCTSLLAGLGLSPFTATHIEVLGAESCYGPHARANATREAVLRVTATHPRKEALDLLAREVAPAGTSWSPGTTGAGGGRASASPSIRQYAFLLPKAHLSPVVHIDGTEIAVPLVAGSADAAAAPSAASAPALAPMTRPEAASTSELCEVPLIRLAWARSGDKGDISNIGVIARSPELLPLLRVQVTEAAVAAYLAHLVKGRVMRYEVPGIHAFNFVCEQALDGGGMSSMRNDPLGKGMAQILLSMPIRAPVALLARCSVPQEPPARF